MVIWMVCKRDDENAKRKQQAKKKNGITEFKESTITDHAVQNNHHQVK